MTHKQTSRNPDEAKFTSYGRLEAAGFIVLALMGCLLAGMALAPWPNRPVSLGAWLGRFAMQAILMVMGVGMALAYASLARARLHFGRRVITTDASGLTFTQDSLRKVVPWHEVQEYIVGAFHDALIAADERIAITGGGPKLRAIIMRRLPRGAKLTHLPGWYEWLGIEPPASVGQTTIWPNQATFRYSAGLIAWYLGGTLVLLVLAGVWVQPILTWAGLGPEFIGETAPAILVAALAAAFYAILGLPLAWSGVILLRHHRDVIETDDSGVSLLRGDDRSTITWQEVQRFEVGRFYYRIIAADRVIAAAVPWFFGNPELRRIIEHNLPPTATYRRPRGVWRRRQARFLQ
jgi:hypothetical protein